MNREEIKKRIDAVVTKELGLSTLAADPNIESLADFSFADDLGADSLEVLSLLTALETEFAIEIPDDTADEWRTVEDVYDYFNEVLTR